MRVWILALMIALLPLRGWMGDSMAMGSASHGLAAAGATTQTHCPDHATGTEAPGPHTAAMGEHAAPDAPAAPHAGGHGEAASSDQNAHSHDLCDVCNGPAMAPQLADLASDAAPPALRVTRAVPFLSHLPLGEHKPPIA